MTKKYIHILLFFLFINTGSMFAQEGKPARAQENAIEGLSVYPNPVSGDRVYITSRANSDKEVTLYDVLGKKVLQTVLTSKELNISNLTPGVYILQIKEEEATATRKLIIK
jgi:hypothetical protein